MSKYKPPGNQNPYPAIPGYARRMALPWHNIDDVPSPVIYRLKTSSEVYGRWLMSPSIEPLPGESSGIHPFDYGGVVEEIPQLPAWPHCRLFRTPILAEWNIDTLWKVEVGRRLGPFPEIVTQSETTLVSERVKRIIEAVDDFGHQFWPARFRTESGRSVEPEQPFYTLNVRRWVHIEPSDTPMDHADFSPDSPDEGFLSRIQHTPALRQRLATLPLWRVVDDQRRTPWELYMNQDLVARLLEAGISGVSEYSVYWGKKWESLGHV